MKRNPQRWLWLVLLVPIVIGFSRLRFDVEVLNLLPSQSPVVRGLQLYQQHFGNARELMITLRADDPDKVETAAQLLATRLRAVSNLVSEVTWQPPWQERPDQSAELIAHIWLNQPPEVFRALTNRLAPENLDTVLNETREQLSTSLSPQELAQLSYDPFGLMRLPENVTSGVGLTEGQQIFSSADRTFRLIFVHPKPQLRSYRQCRAWLQQVKQIAGETLQSDPALSTITVKYTGWPAFMTDIGGGMESDFAGPSIGTLAVIAILFYYTHRRILPLVWLVALLIFILAATLAFGGLFYGTLNVISLGFASILLGLAEDFGIVLYQESQTHPELPLTEVRRLAQPGIFWSALTTSGAFLLLNLSGLPGLGQLGSLVAIGIVLAAIVMLYAYLPPLLRRKTDGTTGEAHGHETTLKSSRTLSRKFVWVITGLLVITAVFLLWKKPPVFERSAESLRPKQSEAYDAMAEIKRHMGQSDPTWLIVKGANEQEVAHKLSAIEAELNRAVSNQLIAKFTLPTTIWPRPDFQKQNVAAAKQLWAEEDILEKAASAHGFSSNALAMTSSILATWRQAAASSGAFWPTNDNSRWILEKIAAHDDGEFHALGLIYPVSTSGSSKQLSNLATSLPKDVWISNWDLLGTSISGIVLDEMPKVIVPIFILVLVSLWLAFRSVIDVVLSLSSIVVSGLLLVIVMAVCGWSWNMMNLMSLPLLLGLGVDFSIHMQLALRRYGGNWNVVHASIGKALLLAGSTTVAGFASVAFSSNAGIASLGKVCGTGIACALAVAVFLLPAWWQTFTRFRKPNSEREFNAAASSQQKSSGPSSFYGPALWSLGLKAVRLLPPALSNWICRCVLKLYFTFQSERREIVVGNLLPALNGNRAAAERTADELIRNFSQKLVDLFRYEGGASVDHLFTEVTGWEHFMAVKNSGRGALLITPHLGNWEFGAPLLAKKNVKLLVVTLAEPGQGFTELRQASRARWGIETLVIGENPFSFVEIIKRLQQGETVALLVDRPPAPSAVEVELFSRPFPASIAAAELARASGCALLPTYLIRTESGYAAHMLPEIPYDRAQLNNREARRSLTQEIMRAFEPVIKQHLDQWYHFVPIWPEEPVKHAK